MGQKIKSKIDFMYLCTFKRISIMISSAFELLNVTKIGELLRLAIFVLNLLLLVTGLEIAKLAFSKQSDVDRIK